MIEYVQSSGARQSGGKIHRAPVAGARAVWRDEPHWPIAWRPMKGRTSAQMSAQVSARCLFRRHAGQVRLGRRERGLLVAAREQDGAAGGFSNWLQERKV